MSTMEFLWGSEPENLTPLLWLSPTKPHRLSTRNAFLKTDIGIHYGLRYSDVMLHVSNDEGSGNLVIQ